jgi:hypothetical protein
MSKPQTLDKNLGDVLALVVCSNAYASLISVGSLQARPKKEIPIGSRETYPAGTVMLGYPATAAADEDPPFM